MERPNPHQTIWADSMMNHVSCICLDGSTTVSIVLWKQTDFLNEKHFQEQILKMFYFSWICAWSWIILDEAEYDMQWGWFYPCQRAETSFPNGVLQSRNPEDYFWHPVFLPGFSTGGSTGPIKKLRGVMREKSGAQFLDTVNSTFNSRVWVRVNIQYFLR